MEKPQERGRAVVNPFSDGRQEAVRRSLLQKSGIHYSRRIAIAKMVVMQCEKTARQRKKSHRLPRHGGGRPTPRKWKGMAGKFLCRHQLAGNR
ncbi:MAG: hypothetical protein KJZ73_01065 [Pseudorhodoplanes sp.]|nr:hypothetical protein [Pseudorhodoplanes sp.]